MNEKFAHTPGPWVASFTHLSEVRATNGAVIAKCQKLNGLVTLQANQRLIAKAPCLFEIATELSAILEGLENGSSSAEEKAAELARKARALIAMGKTSEAA